MPIKGLTDRGMSFPEIGIIRKGAKKTQNAPGRDLTYFRIEFDEREKEAEDLFRTVYGNEPTELNIILPFNEIERMWDAWYEAYTAGRMIARADGEKYIYRVNTTSGEIMVKNSKPITPFEEGEVIGTWKNSNTGKIENVVCKPVGRLKVMIRELPRMVYMTVLTGSIHDIINLSSQLEALKYMNSGQLAGIPLILRRRPKKISTPKADGSRARYEKWMLSIEADPEWVKPKIVEITHLALPGNGLALLPEGEQEPENIIEDPEEGDDDWIPPTGEDVSEGDFEQTEPEPEPEPVINTPELIRAKAIKMASGKTLGDMTVDELTVIIEDTAKPAGLKGYAGLVRDSKLPKKAVQPALS